MKATRKPKAAASTMRDRYTWHVHAPFTHKFDHAHWWETVNGSKEVSPVAALYELCRRHPLIGEVRLASHQKGWHGMELQNLPHTGKSHKRLSDLAYADLGDKPGAVHCLCLIGLKTWEKLSGREKEWWEDVAGNIKGLECRSDLERCTCLNNEAITDIIIRRGAKLKRGKKATSNEEFHRSLGLEFVKHRPGNDEIEAAIKEYSLHALRNDFLLIAIAPDLTIEDAAALLEKQYREYRKLWRVPNQRARDENWLPIISEFENDEINHQKVKSQVFARYRRTMDLVSFGASGGGIHPFRCRHILAARQFFLERFVNTAR